MKPYVGIVLHVCIYLKLNYTLFLYEIEKWSNLCDVNGLTCIIIVAPHEDSIFVYYLFHIEIVIV